MTESSMKDRSPIIPIENDRPRPWPAQRPNRPFTSFPERREEEDRGAMVTEFRMVRKCRTLLVFFFLFSEIVFYPIAK